MKRFNFYNLIFTSLLVIFSLTTVKAQNQNSVQESANLLTARAARQNLLHELDLSKAQIQRIRRLNQERKQVMQESQRHLREAIRALDEAIYSESDNEAEIQLRLKEVQLAHTELITNRTFTERAVRKILTPEQLSRFRSLRSEFMKMNNPENRVNNSQNRLPNLPGGLRRRRFENRQNPRAIQ